MWVAWYGTTGVVWTVYGRRQKPTTPPELPPAPPTVERPPAEALIAATVNDDGDYVVATGNPTKPDWMA